MPSTKREGRILYEATYDQWEVWDVYARTFPMHCGESFELKIGQHFLPCSIELDSQWYIRLSNTKFYLHPNVSYWVRM